MIWQQLKSNLNNQSLRPQVLKMLNVAKAWGHFGTGSGGQMTEYILSRIAALHLPNDGQPRSEYYFHCGKWWSEYAQMFPQVYKQSDVLYVKLKLPMQQPGISQPQSILKSGLIQHIEGVSVKACHNFDKQVRNIQTKFKAYSSGNMYSREAFGKLFQQLNIDIRAFKNDAQDIDKLPQYFRDVQFLNHTKPLLQKIQTQLKHRLSSDPIKVHFDKNGVKIFRVPIKQLWSNITINDIVMSEKHPASQGRFSIVGHKNNYAITVYGDRIMIGEGFDKQKISEDMFNCQLAGEEFYLQLMSGFEMFLS